MKTVKALPNGTELNVMGGAYGRDEVYDEDIEVVIKIPKYAYDDLQKNKNLPNRLGIEKAITNGTVLPKGHGRLIDADKFIENAQEDRKHSCYVKSWTADDVLDYLNPQSTLAPTVVEADKEVENNK